METTLPESILVHSQVKHLGPKTITFEGEKMDVFTTIRFDDRCGNGRNMLSITGEAYKAGRPRTDRNCISSGACHDIILKAFPELKDAVKFHLTSTDGPLHYVANSVYHASDRDCWGRRKGEASRYETTLKFRSNGIFFPISYKPDSKILNWVKDQINFDHFDGPGCEIVACPHSKDIETYGTHYAYKSMLNDCPPDKAWYSAPFKTEQEAKEFLEACQNYEVHLIETPTAWSQGKESDLQAARNCAIWPDAELSDFTEEKLVARLPGLMNEFKSVVESLGFTY